MYNNKQVLGIIPARGGSKGIKRKNIKLLAGKPLIAWTIEEAKKSKYIDRLIVSTDDKEIIDISIEWGCEVPFIRPSRFAKDKTPGIAPVHHALGELPERYDYVVLLQPTSPLRTVKDIDGGIKKGIGNKTCVSVTEATENPSQMFYSEGFNMRPVIEESYVCRQDMPKVYIVNGAIFMADTKWISGKDTFIDDETVMYVMPPERSYDIDTMNDFTLVENIIKSRG